MVYSLKVLPLSLYVFVCLHFYLAFSPLYSVALIPRYEVVEQQCVCAFLAVFGQHAHHLQVYDVGLMQLQSPQYVPPSERQQSSPAALLQCPRERRYGYADAYHAVVFGVPVFHNRYEVEVCQWQNITNSVSDIISLRFTINFAYYFLKTPGGALVRLAAAGVLGGIRTAADAYGIFVSNDGCTLLPNNKGPKLKYTDYLLIKVFLENHKKAKLLDTIQATLLVRDTERKADLKKMYTAVSATVEVKVDLIFLKLFGFELIDLGSFNNGYYTVKNTVQMKY